MNQLFHSCVLQKTMEEALWAKTCHAGIERILRGPTLVAKVKWTLIVEHEKHHIQGSNTILFVARASNPLSFK